MLGDLPDVFVPRPTEYQQLKDAVLSEHTDKMVALTTALRGAGGYGKTTLANYLCRDDDVRFEFTDGILRVEIGKERGDVTGLVIDLIEKLEPGGKRPGFADVVTASEHLGELIGERRILLVIDDVWREAQLRPFLRGGKNCVRLVTTRLPHVLPRHHVPIRIDGMPDDEARSLLSANLPGADTPAVRAKLSALADRLGNWPQMLGIANGWMRDRVAKGETLRDALAHFERRLSARGLTGFDPKDETQRNRAIRACVDASLEDLAAEERDRFGELSILPEDEDVPLSVIEALWRETGGIDAFDTDDLVRRLDARSLLQNLDLRARTLRVHDNMIWYLRDRIGADLCRAAHTAMVRTMRGLCAGAWATLPQSEDYSWRFLIRHLRAAGRADEADRLLCDYAWVKAKMRASGARGLFESYLPEGRDEGGRLIGRAIALSVRALASYPRELPRQLYGRLGGYEHPAAVAIVSAARRDPDFHPAPRWPGLTPPGAERLQFVGHERRVRSAYFSPDGARIVTASDDRTARLWDANTGQELVALRGHGGRGWGWVQSACFSPDGARIVTASDDRTARLWDATSGQQLATLRGHEGGLNTACFSLDGARILTASGDGTARLWDESTWEGLAALRGHERPVTSAFFSPDSARIVTASDDRTARLWDATSGRELAALRGHESRLNSASFSPDGARIVTASDDCTARLWDATSGQQLAAFRGHNDLVQSACFSPDGALIVTASDDRTARLWDATTGEELAALRGHEYPVNSAFFSPDGALIVTASNDRTARLWDVTSGEEAGARRGHNDRVRAACFSPNGARIVTASDDHTARLWDATTGEKQLALCGHNDRVQSACFSPSGARIVTASDDHTARLWDATAGEEQLALHEHDEVQSACFSPDGARILTVSDIKASLWNAITGDWLDALHRHTDRVQSACFSPDGARILTASDDRTARLWDATTRNEVAELRGHEKGVQSACFSTDGAFVVTASKDGTARLWDASTGQELATLRGHESVVLRACFSRDGARIVTASDDRTVRLWDASTGQQIACIALDAAVHGLDVHRGTIALADALGRIHVFDADEFLCAAGSVRG
jgi:WD40 repeat protein